ncbi:uncharacterized protein At1g15400-like [Olea europaea var. sylvestris]|uniref:uncharacterized protein At1g15400-like n=1 Tax=Olea europaea var. sylvestris TaxID=158386 RepID=UPI000C1D01CA|nr:uncharacterized protein At1g15400-like [Olea europaea var. sylvestris]
MWREREGKTVQNFHSGSAIDHIIYFLREMSGLPRSEISFRRQGSSGLVWDDKLNLEVKKKHDPKPAVEQSPREYVYRSRTVTLAVEPPSPKVSCCCGKFGKPPHHEDLMDELKFRKKISHLSTTSGYRWM